MATVGQAIESVLMDACNEDIELIVVNDGLDEATAKLADRYPVKVIPGDGSGPASARNIGVQASQGEILIFLDADCRVSKDWLSLHLEMHERYNGLLSVGGSICLEPNASFWARCDHYCSWYNVHPHQREAWVPNHPSANLSVSRSTFERIGPFKEDLPKDGVHEEIEWQGRLLFLGGRIRFEPRAAVWHRDRGAFKSYLKHNYGWGYNSIEIKSRAAVSRFSFLYQKPWALICGFIPFAVAHTFYTIVCWLKAGKLEPLFLSPVLFLGRIAYAIGMTIGGIRVLQNRKTRDRELDYAR